MENTTYIGALDIGGTKILAGIIDKSGTLVARGRIQTLAQQGTNAVIARAITLLCDLMQERGISATMLAGIGCSVPGPLDRERGIVLFSPNLAWRDVPLAAIMREQLGVPVEIEDDARCAALGEARKGAARGVQNAVYVTISTGIGSGVIINGNIYRGTHGFAGEVGHMTLDAYGPSCLCGNTGCFESLASGSAIASHGKQAALLNDETLLAQFRATPDLITAEQVILAAEAGDSVALNIIQTAAMYIGIGLAAIATMFDPELLVLGGGVIRPDSLVLHQARAAFIARTLQPLKSLIPIVPAALADESSLWGAAALVSHVPCETGR